MPRGRRAGVPNVTPARAPATDLTAARELTALSGMPVVDVARATLDAGRRLLASWDDLEPLVRTLTKKVRARVEGDELEPAEEARLLSLCASVVQRVGAASTAVLRASEGQARLGLVLQGGVERPKPKQMTEQQLAAVVIETVKKIALERQTCVCGFAALKDIEVEGRA